MAKYTVPPPTPLLRPITDTPFKRRVLKKCGFRVKGGGGRKFFEKWPENGVFRGFLKKLYCGSAVDYHVWSSFASRTRWHRPFSPIRVTIPAKARLKVGSVHGVYKYRIPWDAPRLTVAQRSVWSTAARVVVSSSPGEFAFSKNISRCVFMSWLGGGRPGGCRFETKSRVCTVGGRMGASTGVEQQVSEPRAGFIFASIFVV